MSNADLYRFVQRLTAVEKEVRANKTPQLAYSSMHDGSLDVFDRTGNFVGRLGKQHDGTYVNATFNGPPPPTPQVAFVAPAIGGARVYWDGTLADGGPLPMNFTRITIHAVLDPGDYSPTDSAQVVGEIATGLGAEVFVPLSTADEHYILLTLWNDAGRFSAPSTPVYVAPLSGEYTPPEIVAPTVSPAIDSVTGAPSALIVVTEPKGPDDYLEYHISTTEDFVATGATLAMPATASTIVTIAALPDGQPLVGGGQEYYLRVVAVNEAGRAPASSPAVSGKLDASAVEAIIAQKLIAGFVLAGQVTVGNITLHPETGITIRQPGGNVIHFPADPTKFAEITGHLTATTLAVIGTMSIDGGAVVNSKMVLAAGITAPSTPPTLSPFWPSSKWQDPYTFGDVFFGLANKLADDGSGATDPAWLVTAVAFYGSGIRLIHRQTGETWALITTESWKSLNPTGGITQIGSSYYVLGQDPARNNNWFIYRLNYQFQKVAEVNWTTSGAFDGRPAIGRSDSGLPIVAYIAAGSKKLSISRRDPVSMEYVSGSVVAAVASNPSGGASTHNISAVHEGIVDLGAGNSRIYVATENQKKVTAYTDSAGALVRSSTLDFGTAGVATKGVVFDRADLFLGAGRWTSLDTTGNVHRYSGLATATPWRARSTFVDVNPGGDGLHETAPSGYSATATIPARAWIRVQVASAPDANSTDPSKPDKADRSRVYVGASPGEPVLQATLAVGSKSLELDQVGTGVIAPAIPQDFTSAGSTAASIEDPTGAYYFNGLGDAAFRNLIVHTPVLHLRRNAAQNLAAGAATTVAFDRVDLADQWAPFTTATTVNTSAVTVVRSGLYEITGSMAPAVAGTGTLWHLGLMIDGTVTKILYRGSGSPVSPLVARGSSPVYLQAGQSIGLSIYNNAGAASATYPGSQYATELIARWVSP